MEKRLVLSIALSFVVLYLWAALGPKPPLHPKPAINSQTTDTKEVRSKQTAENTPVDQGDDQEEDQKALSTEATPAPEAVADSQAPAKTYDIENSKLKITFSSKGGNIKEVYIKEYDAFLPTENINSLPAYDNKKFELSKLTDTSVEFKLVSGQQTITKSYELSRDDYIVNSVLKVSGNNEMSNLDNIAVEGFTLNITKKDHINDKGIAASRNKRFYEYVVQTNEKSVRKGSAYKFSDKDRKTGESPVKWVGFRDRYFCVIVKPDKNAVGYSIANETEHDLEIKYHMKKSDISSAGNLEIPATIYMGPEKIEKLKQYHMGFENIQRYYRFGLFDSIAKIIQGLMHLIHKVVPNWGACILLVSILVYACTYPMTIRSMQSMRKMQRLQPKMKKIKEKYADNPQKMNQEMMGLYKKEKVNPLGGCLPMFLQLPVFIGLYQVLWRSVEFKHAKFLWIKDLSEPDRLIVLKHSFPIIGNEINLLPILMMIIMFIQQKLSAKNMVTADPMQAQQQKMMQTIFPIFLGFIFYKFSSGLTLYFTMFYAFSSFTQWKLSRQPQEA